MEGRTCGNGLGRAGWLLSGGRGARNLKKFRGRAMPASGESGGFPAPRGNRGQDGEKKPPMCGGFPSPRRKTSGQAEGTPRVAAP